MADITAGESIIGKNKTTFVDDEMGVWSAWGVVAWEEGINLDNAVVIRLLEATKEGAINVGWVAIVIVIT